MSRLSLQAAAAAEPEGLALLLDGTPWRFAALAEAARRMQAWLQTQGVVPSAGPVALVARLGLPELLALYALFDLGVPVLPLHPRLTEAEQAEALRETPAPLLRPPDLAALPPPAPPPPAPPDDGRPLAILHTSGSTGRPKGVILSRAAFGAAAAASSANLGWQPDDRWLLCMPMAHVGGLSIVTRCLIARRALALRPTPRLDPQHLAATLAEDQITLLSLVPTMLQRLLDLSPPWSPPPSLRALLLGGAPAPPRLLQEAARRRVPVLTTYGLTESCAQVTTQRYGTAPDPSQGAGPPLPGVELRIDPADGAVELRGPMLLSGYAGGEPPPRTTDGFLRTGDIGALDEEGRLHLRGRRGDLIITGGENVYPAEVEAALCASPQIAAACAFAVPDPLWGEIVAAALVPAGSTGSVDLAALRADLAGRLAPHRQPRRVALVAELPQTPSGKTDRAACARLAAPLLRSF